METETYLLRLNVNKKVLPFLMRSLLGSPHFYLDVFFNDSNRSGFDGCSFGWKNIPEKPEKNMINTAVRLVVNQSTDKT